MSEPVRVAIIVAMKFEIAPLLKRWGQPWLHVDYSLRVSAPDAHVFHYDDVLLVAGGIGRQPAAIAARAVIETFSPKMIISAGLAGALTSALKVGDIVRPERVVDGASGEGYNVGQEVPARGVLLTAASVLSSEGKKQAAEQHGADAVDMEAAVVASAAASSGIPFLALKAISDLVDFEMPPLDRFIDSAGRPNLIKLLAYASIRPRVWSALAHLKRNGDLATARLCFELERVVAGTQAPVQ